jgi:hypothetical protein
VGKHLSPKARHAVERDPVFVTRRTGTAVYRSKDLHHHGGSCQHWAFDHQVCVVGAC